MSTKISAIYDEVRSLVSTALSNHVELNNPYFIEDDADVMYDMGYTVGLLGGVNTNRLSGCTKASIARDFNIVLTRRYQAPSRDIDKRVEAEKNIFEDQIILIKAIEADPSSNNIANIKFVSDNGLEFLEGDRFGFLVLQTTISVEYFENL